MPYYVHPLDEDPVETARVCFSHAVHARAAKQSGETVTFVVNPHELREWQARERTRFDDGTYIEVPWSDYSYVEAGRTMRHYAHLSLKFVGRVAFTKSAEHGTLDRQTVMRPGRYLEQYMSAYDLTQRQAWIGIVSSLKSELKIARTPDEIEQVYVNGPRSCMSGVSSAYASNEHPVRAYGNSDLAVAYIGDLDGASARAVVWPEKKLHGRCYGSDAVLRALLERDGYTHGDYDAWRGAKMRCLEQHGRYVMPYLDIAETVNIRTINGTRWAVVAAYDGDYSARSTDGLTGRPNCCERCDTEIDEDENYCESCLDASSICPDCDERTWDDNRDGYCDSCASHYCECAHCEEWIHEDNSSYLDTQDMTVCESCWEKACECEVCEERFLEEAYPRSVRADRGVLADRVCYKCQRKGAFICEKHDAAVEGGETCGDCDNETTEPEEATVCAS